MWIFNFIIVISSFFVGEQVVVKETIVPVQEPLYQHIVIEDLNYPVSDSEDVVIR